jgi:hypothetical protein
MGKRGSKPCKNGEGADPWNGELDIIEETLSHISEFECGPGVWTSGLPAILQP